MKFYFSSDRISILKIAIYFYCHGISILKLFTSRISILKLTIYPSDRILKLTTLTAT